MYILRLLAVSVLQHSEYVWKVEEGQTKDIK